MKKLNVLLVMSMITMMSLVGCKKPTPKPSDSDVTSESSAPDEAIYGNGRNRQRKPW